jgi:death-on-curing protein
VALQYLTVDDVFEINQEVNEGTALLRDITLLESAVARPQASAFGQDAYATLFEKAAALFHSLALNHPFIDGNKRTATLAVIDFLYINGFQITWVKEEALEYIVEIAEGKRNVDQIAEWLRHNTQAIS